MSEQRNRPPWPGRGAAPYDRPNPVPPADRRAPDRLARRRAPGGPGARPGFVGSAAAAVLLVGALAVTATPAQAEPGTNPAAPTPGEPVAELAAQAASRPASAPAPSAAVPVPSAAPVEAPALGLDDAVALALGREEPRVAAARARARALDERAVAEGQLPDPELRVGLANMPVDSFDFDQEPMTQVQVGVRQAFPRGRTLAETRARTDAEAEASRARARLERRRVVLETRLAWLELAYWLTARRIVDDQQAAVTELVRVIETAFATGTGSNQDLLRAELELSLLDDRAVEVARRIETVRADLSRYVGAAAARPLPDALPTLSPPPDRRLIAEALARHPQVTALDARVDARGRDVAIARQAYKPRWALDLAYGARVGGRADFASVGVTLDVPLFTDQRQDRRLAAARQDRQAARLDRQAVLLDLRQRLDRTHAAWMRLGQRVGLYERVVRARADANADAALDGYQNQVADFAELIRSRLEALDTRLTLRRLRTDRAKAQAELLYLAQGDGQ
ncbi:outer membrane protein TolC [Rhodothalassium salexigens DSM 2132]|uniref:Outer membrane protein TolC n=1 Tax=Rhodothalassium salexigens DSM 2132 TaxID=1188247 RepID=A0A4R2PEW0_RHOSA|nr:TolC family protein [Rhodothalassium salexigens]MBB4212160.1 outer membrane protein TolC [Rhodothalassium salexigens DSM 2132]TCP33034.1 outer membrane protein TolC [Rhodothalassium salexigens DSM 2132]